MHIEDDRLYVLLDRYLAGEASAAEAQTVREWLAADPEHAVLLDDLRLIRRVATERVPESSVDAAWAKVVHALEAPPRPAAAPAQAIALVPSAQPLRMSRRVRLAALAAAAVVVALVGARFVWRAPAWRESSTVAAHRAVVRLRDGTQVTLAPGSRLRYLTDFGESHRDVYLDGEAYFQVAPDARVPFRVRTARSVTQDVGTAFVVTAYGDQGATEVVVAEGRVALWRADTTETIQPHTPPALMLTARDLGRLEPSGATTLRRGVDIERQLAWIRGVLAFDGTPLRDAVRTLERWYNVEIHLESDSALAERRLTATFTNEPIDLVLNRIALTLDLRIAHVDESVLLLRKGS
jgi:ferric-dicitrate binding protein FerR (iron transport regulator)